jgi:hypothetical protein
MWYVCFALGSLLNSIRIAIFGSRNRGIGIAQDSTQDTDDLKCIIFFYATLHFNLVANYVLDGAQSSSAPDPKVSPPPTKQAKSAKAASARAAGMY